MKNTKLGQAIAPYIINVKNTDTGNREYRLEVPELGITFATTEAPGYAERLARQLRIVTVRDIIGALPLHADINGAITAVQKFYNIPKWYPDRGW